MLQMLGSRVPEGSARRREEQGYCSRKDFRRLTQDATLHLCQHPIPVIFPIAVPILPLGLLGASNKKAGSLQRLFRISHVVPHLTGETLQLCPGLFISRNHQRAKLMLHSSGLPAALYVLCSLGASNTVCGKGDPTKEVGVRYSFKPRALVYYFHQPMGFSPSSINFFLFLC